MSQILPKQIISPYELLHLEDNNMDFIVMLGIKILTCKQVDPWRELKKKKTSAEL